MIMREVEQTSEAAQRERAAAEHRRRQEVERMRRGGLAPDDIRAVIQRCADAARAGHGSVLAYRFPSEICLDGGRAINNDDPDWAATLAGQPRALYEDYQNVLHPAGYRIQAKILNFPNGFPGDGPAPQLGEVTLASPAD